MRRRPITIESAKDIARAMLPARLALQDVAHDAQVFVTFSPQRSGQHVIIAWLCRGFGSALHLNHCKLRRIGASVVLWPQQSRVVSYQQGHEPEDTGNRGLDTLATAELPGTLPYDAVLYSIEDETVGRLPYRTMVRRVRPDRVVLILRDPYNWLASCVKLWGDQPEILDFKMRLYKRCLADALANRESRTLILYPRFITSVEYRRELARTLAMPYPEEADEALERTQTFGGGSSFGTSDRDPSTLLARWKMMVDHPEFERLAADPELFSLGKQIFGEFPGAEMFKSGPVGL